MSNRSIEVKGSLRPELFRMQAVAEFRAALGLPQPALLSEEETVEVLHISSEIYSVISPLHPRTFVQERPVSMPILPAADEPEALHAVLAHLVQGVRQRTGIQRNEDENITKSRDASIIDGVIAVVGFIEKRAHIDTMDDHYARRAYRDSLTPNVEDPEQLTEADLRSRHLFEVFHNTNQFRGASISSVSFALGGIAQAIEPYDQRLAVNLQDQERKIVHLHSGKTLPAYEAMDIKQKLAVVRVVTDTGSSALRRLFGDTVRYGNVLVT